MLDKMPQERTDQQETFKEHNIKQKPWQAEM